MGEVSIDLSLSSKQAQISICRSFFNGPNGFTAYMERPEVKARYIEWLAKKNEAAPTALGTTSSEISDTIITNWLD